MAIPTAVQSHPVAWLISCLLIFQPFSAGAKTIKAMMIQQHPGRTILSGPAFKQGRSVHPEAVAMHHSVFFMDADHLPRLQNNKTHVLLQLTQHLTQTMEADLHGLGVELQEYIPNNTWKAVIPSHRMVELRSLPEVKAIGDILLEDKLPRQLMEQSLMAARSNEGAAPLDLLIAFYDDIPFERAREIAENFFKDVNQNVYLSGNRIRIQIPASRLAEIAAYDEVNWIEAGGRVKKPANCSAAKLSNVDHVQSGDFELDGFGVVLGLWDGGAVDNTHPDLSEQVTVYTSKDISAHATGVAGTLVGRGECSATGMAPGATLYSFDYGDIDVPWRMKAAKNQFKMIIANHSWVYKTGWEYSSLDKSMWEWFGDDMFGNYTSTSADWDSVIRWNGIISVNGAGNDRDDAGALPGVAHHHKGRGERLFYDSHPRDGDYGCISDIAVAKNVITVGAVDDHGNMTDFSSWGPTNDGRIKPDLVANGVDLETTALNGNHKFMSGTSFSTPVVSGAAALLVQAYRLIMDADPSPAMVKALLVNTAKDRGEAGPDYQYGWGLVDLLSAVNTLNTPVILLNENHLSTNLDMLYTVHVLPDTPVLKVTVAWSDMHGSPAAAKALVNDIDLVLIDPDGVAYEPWVLDADNPGYPAGTGVNSVDNVEQVLVQEPREGEWTLRVKGTQIQLSQDYAIVSNLAMQKVVKAGSVFQVDDQHSEKQSCPAISSGKNSLFLVVWSVWNPGKDGWDIYGQYFFDSGKKWKEEFKVNTYALQDQIKPAVITLSEMLTESDYVVTWSSLGQDGNGYGVFGQRFNLVGDRIGNEFQVNTYTQNDQKHSSMAALKSGGYVIAWESSAQDASGLGIFAQRFHADGTQSRDEFQVNTFSEYDQSHPSVAMLEDGGFVITWHSQNQDGDDWGVFGQRFDNQGHVSGTEFQLNATNRHAQQSPAILSVSKDAFLATWTSECQNDQHMGQDIYSQGFGYDGVKIGTEIQVNTLTDLNHQNPSVSALRDSGFMVTWNTRFAPEKRWEIHGQLFNDMGDRTGEAFQVVRYTGGEQSFHSMDMLTCGKYVVTWCSGAEQTEYKGIFGRQFMVIDKPYIDISANDSDGSGDNSGCMVDLITN